MKKLNLLIILLLISSVCIFAQVPTDIYGNMDVIQLHSQLKPATKSIPVKKMKQVDNLRLQAENKQREGMTGIPYRFGYGFEVDYTLEDGSWENQDSVRVWNLRVSSPGAYSLNFIFERLFLAEGARLYIFNTDGSMVYGPVTQEQNPSGEFYLTDLIAGEEVIIQLIEPSHVKESSFVKISKVVHAYVNLFPDRYQLTSAAQLSCHNDINCYPDWKNESDAVALVLLANGTELCSGSLLNNTRQD